MTNQDEPRVGCVQQEEEELPQMDGSCDACEPDEAQPATLVCHTCSFAFCPAHADEHAGSTRHPLAPYSPEEALANRPQRGAGVGVGAMVGNAGAGAGTGVEIDPMVAEVALCDARIQAMEAAGVAVGGAGDAGGEAGLEARGQAAVGAGAGDGNQALEGEAVVGGEPGKRDTVTVERLRCKEHGQEGSLYCKVDEKIICVVCAVQGEHRQHEIITLHEAYVWQKSRDGYDLLGCTQQMADKIKTKWTNPEMSTEQLEAYVNGQFDELHRLVRLEERRTLHLVDLKEAFLTAAAAEKIAEITVHTERLQEEMASITQQLGQLDQAEAQPGTGVGAEAPAEAPGPGLRPPRDLEARPRLPEPRRDPRDYDGRGHGPSMGHAP